MPTSTSPSGVTTEAPGAEEQTGQSANPKAPASPAVTAEPTIDERIAAARREAADQARFESTRAYQGLQRTLSQVQAENARLKEQSKALGYLPGLVAGMQTLLTETLGPEKAKVMQVLMENEQLKAGIAAAQQAPAPATPAYQEQPVDLRQARTQALTYWFPDTTLSAEDPRLDWAQDAPSPEEAQARFRRSVVKAERQDAGKAAKDEADQQVAAEKKKTSEALREAGVERSDGSQPTGEQQFLQNALTSKDPKEWNAKRLLTLGYEQQDARQLKEQRKNGRLIGS